MVSRAGKLQFSQGERVLCYEPDPTKAKVLYDSKVLDVVINKDSKGKRVVEYLIHFQGWNSSWDRCVHEEFVLKDTSENRQLQRDLAEQSQLQLGAYLYRRERKKYSRKVSEHRNINAQLSEDGSSGSPAQTIDTEESASALSSSEVESIVDEEMVPIELTNYLRNVLEHDYHLINNKNKLMKLPAEPHVVAILENYWKYYCSSLLCELSDKSNRRLNKSTMKVQPEDLQHHLNICKEMLDGMRIYFDFTLCDLLLYKSEKGQVDVAYAKNMPMCSSIKREEGIGNRPEDLEYAHLPNITTNDILGTHKNNHIALRTRRRSLRSNKIVDVPDTNGIIPQCEPAPIHPRETRHTSVANSDAVSEGMGKMLSWRILPNYVYNQQPLPPSLMYGATHLLRLFVKLPELLNASGIMENKLKILQQHLEVFLSFLTDHKEWYGDKFYLD